MIPPAVNLVPHTPPRPPPPPPATRIPQSRDRLLCTRAGVTHPAAHTAHKVHTTCRHVPLPHCRRHTGAQILPHNTFCMTCTHLVWTTLHTGSRHRRHTAMSMSRQTLKPLSLAPRQDKSETAYWAHRLFPHLPPGILCPFQTVPRY